MVLRIWSILTILVVVLFLILAVFLRIFDAIPKEGLDTEASARLFRETSRAAPKNGLASLLLMSD